jgi:hypothetical protein
MNRKRKIKILKIKSFSQTTTISDTPLSPLLDPLEGLSRLNCGKLGLKGRSQLPALEKGKGAC